MESKIILFDTYYVEGTVQFVILLYCYILQNILSEKKIIVSFFFWGPEMWTSPALPLLPWIKYWIPGARSCFGELHALVLPW